jgi:hypothetical protein
LGFKSKLDKLVTTAQKPIKFNTMKISIFTLILTLCIASIATAQKEDKKKSGAGAPPGIVEGVIYALPHTGIRVHVKATHESIIHGPFQMYAKKMLGIDNVPATDADRWNMDEIRIEVFSEPDPDQVFKTMGHAAQMLSHTESGILAGINTMAANKETSLQPSSFPMKGLDKPIKFTDLSVWSFYAPADSTQKGKMVSKSEEQKAAEAAETIFNIRSSRYNLLTNADNEPLPDGKSFEVMRDELGKMEENYLSLFIGKSSKEKCEFSFDFIPGQKTVKGEVFFRFSEDRGVLPKTDLSGRPIVIDVVKDETLASKQSVLSASANPEAGKSGLYYRIPGISEIRILDGNRQLAGIRTSIAQFGTVVPVPEDLLDGSYKLEFFPSTGAIKSVTEMK